MRMRREPRSRSRRRRSSTLMREAGLVVAPHAARRWPARSSPASPPPSSTPSPSRRSPAPEPPPRSRATTATPPRICTSVNEQIVHGIPSQAAWAEGRRRDLHRLRRDRQRLARRCRAHRGRRRDQPTSCADLLAACEQALLAGPGRRPGRAAGSPTSRTPWSAARGPPGRTGSSRSTSGTASAPRCTWTRRAELRQAGPRTAAGRGDGAGHRADARARRAAHPAAGRRLDRGQRRRQPAAHFEHTVAITADGPWVLTAEDGGASGLAGIAEPLGHRRRRVPVAGGG